MKSRIVTISRQFGSGGRTIGRQLAETLGIPCYDQELIEKIAAESGFAKSYIEDKGEDAVYGSRFMNALLSNRAFDGLTAQDYLWSVQRKVILDLAAQGPCVIVGRCADSILREAADCLRVFIHADLQVRADRIVRLYGERTDSPEKRLQEKDKRRAVYYQFYTETDWGDARNYDITLDSGVFGIEKCVELIAGLY